ncbi:HAMP domain-containing histidine kinase [Candidatus Saccharibacteria bacterium]|nr:HAMP domain-containing histidine kinase [Candidatus Saccharibacteria bacterium]
MQEVNNSIFVAAHELKAPLALMRQLALALDPDNPVTTTEYQQKLISVSDRAMRQVNDLAKIARLEDGLFEMEPIAVRGLCEEVVGELKYLFRFNQKHLQIRYTNKDRLVVANRELLGSIIYNFCVNAIKYADQGSATKLAVTGSRERVRISVRDFGPALPKDIYDKLTGDSLTSPVGISFRPDSSGLGLYIATKFAKYMHADIGAIRHHDGTSFFVELPVSHQGTLFDA